jgi:hypothetical protein
MGTIEQMNGVIEHRYFRFSIMLGSLNTFQ